MTQFEGQFKVGDRVKALVHDFAPHEGRDDLVILYMGQDAGYGVGPAGNDPDMHHSSQKGWLWYLPEEVGPVDG